MNLARPLGVIITFLLMCVPPAFAANGTNAPAANAIENISASGLPGGKVLVKFTFKQALSGVPGTFSVTTPPRIALDFADTANGLNKSILDLREGDLRTMNIVQSGNRTRVVMSLNRPVTYETRTEGKNLLVTIQGGSATTTTRDATTKFAEGTPTAKPHAVKDVDFRRGPNGEGRVITELSDTTTGIDIRRQGKQLVVDFVNAGAQKNVERRLDVADFGTPVKIIETRTAANNVRMTIEPQGLWDHSAYQTDKQFIVEIRKVTEDPNKLVQTTQPGYAGEKLSLNFQNVEVRSVLQVIADFTGLNIIASDSVQGNITLRLKDVPWDQALDIILQSKGLSKRKNGNVVLVAPTDELNTKEKLALEANQQIAELEQVQTESIRLSYQKVDDVKKIIGDEKQRILSKRGTVVVDSRTNTLFIQDTPSRLEEIRRLIQQIDIAVQQVMIEARIVIADDKWSRQIGVRFGGRAGYNRGNNNLGVGTGLDQSEPIAIARNGIRASDVGAGTPNINLPVQSPAGQIAVTLLNIGSGNLLSFELSALEADKRGKVVSSPRVITADKQKAVIEQGTEIPYLQASSAGNTTVAFKPAVLSLAVTPQITPEGRVILDLEVKKDSVGQIFFGTPSIDTKKVITQILVDDGETAVLGGIYEQTIRNDAEKVPVLSSIPVLGRLFKHDTRQDDKTELLVFITPRVLKEALSVR
jgi:type IV pilus assembly protein PilQ